MKVTGFDPGELRYDQRGLLAVVAQEQASGAVLMLAYANRAAVDATLETGEAHFWSRSRQRLWRKGETSGNVLRVVAARADCDGDALLLTVRAAGPACHRGTRTCFEPNPAALELGWLAEVIAGRRGAAPDSSYTARLLAQGVERIGRKVGEEATETVIAAMAATAAMAVSGTNAEAALAGRRSELAGEAADLIYHLLVLLEACGVGAGEVARVLAQRHEASR